MRSELYIKESQDALKIIHLIRYIDKFRKAIRYEDYSHIRPSLVFTRLHYKSELQRKLANRKSVILTGTVEPYREITDEEIKREQFDGCAYSELTHCAISRIHDIKECTVFLSDKDLCLLHPLMEKYVERLLAVAVEELHSLRIMRPLLKNSNERIWVAQKNNFKRDKVAKIDLLEEYETIKMAKRGI